MRLCDQEPQTDQRTGETEERLLHLREPIQAAAQPAEGVQPRDGPLHVPAEHPQATAVLPAALRQHAYSPATDCGPSTERAPQGSRLIA